MTKIVGIADTHGQHDVLKVDNGDILVVAGDFTSRGRQEEVERFNAWLGTQPHKHKIVVAGNHDFFCEKNPALTKQIFTNAIYLDMNEVTVEGIKFWGCPWTPWFYDWAFNIPRGGDHAKRIWAAVPDDTNVIVTHGPPRFTGLGVTRAYFDRGSEDAGCPEQHDRILALPRIKAVFCGHIHPGAGECIMRNGTICHNVAVVNERYEVVRHGLTYNYQ